MPRYIDADKLIDDLEHDIAIDQDHILYVGIDMREKELIQFDKDCKQNCIDMLSKAPTADVRENVQLDVCPLYGGVCGYPSGECYDCPRHGNFRENVKGRWVEVVDRTEMYDKEGVKTWGMLFQCNQCGFVLNAIEGHTGQYNYCPNCGADMRGDNHDNK